MGFQKDLDEIRKRRAEIKQSSAQMTELWASISPNQKRTTIIVLLIICVLFWRGCIYEPSPTYNSNDATTNIAPNARYIPPKNECWVISRQFAKKALKSPSTAEFPFEDVYVYDNGDTITVIAPVDAQNSFGAMLRTRYICQMKYLGGKTYEISNWQLLGVAVEN